MGIGRDDEFWGHEKGKGKRDKRDKGEETSETKGIVSKEGVTTSVTRRQ